MKLSATPTTPEFLAESEEEQAFLQSLATEMIAMLEDTERALAKKEADQLFDLDEGIALWSLLPPKVRTAIKRGRELDRPKVTCQECGLVNAHTRNCTIGGRFA